MNGNLKGREGLVVPTDRGLYCRAGDFYVDPWRPVEQAVITHAHSDHAGWGCRSYVTTTAGQHPLRVRLGRDADIRPVPYGDSFEAGGVRVSLHPAGHILGSAQVRLEHRGEVWVITGDYKVQPDPTCEPFELLRCHTLVTESTFGLPIYRWPPQNQVFADINAWWCENQQRGWTSVVFTYALGKAQRVLAGLDPAIGPILAHGAVRRLLPAYEAAGVALPLVQAVEKDRLKEMKGKAIVIAPTSAAATPWLRSFAPVSTAFVSGWMQVRGARRWLSVDRGFVLSDHADWDGLLGTIDASGADHIAVTHGQTATLVRWLTEHGQDAWAIKTRFSDKGEEELAEPGEGEEVAAENASTPANAQSELFGDGTEWQS